MSTDEKRIREFAYQIWKSEGEPEGQEARHWEMASKLAEAEALAPSKPAARKPAAAKAPVAKAPVAKPAAKTKPAPAAQPVEKATAVKKPKAPKKPPVG